MKRMKAHPVFHGLAYGSPPRGDLIDRFLLMLVAWGHVLALWHTRARQRRRLRELDDHMLADIGKTRAEAVREAKSPFWHR